MKTRYDAPNVAAASAPPISPAVSLRELLYDHTRPAAQELVALVEDGAIDCYACGHRCHVMPNRAGICRVRFNRDGELRVPAGYIGALQIDPIEKKPFFHAYPGHNALSFGMLGCDLHCGYCQNWVTSQALRDDRAVSAPSFCSPDDLVAQALLHGAPVIVSTYNEPLITTEWAVDIFRVAKNAGLVCGFVSNGNGTPQVLEYLRPWVDLYKVDLKGFSDRNYRSLGGVLSNVLDTIKLLKCMDYWVEIVTLVIPGFNDGDDELKGIAEFLAGVSVDIPWHVTAFHPDYKMTDPPRTPVETLLRAYEFGKQSGLRYVYPGNIPGAFGDRENTYCSSCRGLLIRRVGFRVEDNRMNGNHCPVCETVVPGVWEPNPPRCTAGFGRPRSLRVLS